jgi:N-acetyl-beta-hexosaminidase
LPATFELMEQALAGVAAIFPGPYLHIGADEPRGMPDEDYVSYVRRLRRLVRSLGRQPLGWQESARAGHRDRLARHGRLWAQDGLTYFRAATVDWA